DSGDNKDQVWIPSSVYELVKESVVEIRAFVQTLFGQSGATGSGFIVDRQGHIVTNAHVVRDSESIEVAFHDGTILSATLVGLDVYSDLAILRVEAPSHLLEPVVLGDSTVLSIGDPVLAVGNPFGLSGSLTSGIVSQL
ncbi:MAG: trypsin, partial [Candidatus Aenigmarchaeota archaeon]|nr:trypsin [Candidatus Aenigmarchaeota archaeon]